MQMAIKRCHQACNCTKLNSVRERYDHTIAGWFNGVSDTSTMDEAIVKKYQQRLRQHPIVREALELLSHQLPPTVWYHTLAHTEDVLDEAIRFATIDRLPDRQLELLAIAAAWHDVGFIQTPVSNEAIGAAFAREQMRKSGGYSAEEIGLVERMILDTTVVATEDGPRQIPSTELSRYLLDADLSNLGRDDFFTKGELQRKELGQDVEAFRAATIALLSAHRWHTEAARALRQEKRDQNLKAVMSTPAPHKG